MSNLERAAKKGLLGFGFLLLDGGLEYDHGMHTSLTATKQTLTTLAFSLARIEIVPESFRKSSEPTSE